MEKAVIRSRSKTVKKAFSKFILVLNDTLNIFILRMKMIFKSLAVIIAFLISIVITGVLVNSFLEASEEKSSIPIGVIDKDNTQRSQVVIDSLKQLNSVYVFEDDDMETLVRKLTDNDVYVIVQINDGFEKFVKEDTGEKLITVYYAKGNKNMSLISDIILSQVIDEICYNACYKAYTKYDEYELESEEEFREYTDYIYEKYDGLINFDFEILNVEKNKDVTENITNGLLYRLVLIGIITILISFIILFASNAIISDKTYNTDKRIDISPISLFAKNTGDLLALFTTGEIYVIFASLMMFSKLELNSLKHMIVMLITFSIFTLVTSVLFMIITVFIRESVMLQIIGALIVCLCGITGAMEIISVAITKFMRKLANLSPNVFVVRIYNKLIVLSDCKEQFKGFVIFSLIMILLFYIIVFVRNVIRKHLYSHS